MIPTLAVSDFINITNQALENIYPSVIIEGEVESFKINQGKFVFLNLKDEQSSIGCFMMKFALNVEIADGMTVRVRARPKLTTKGKFSLTIDNIRPIGEGSVKKSFDLLRTKLEAEGLFAPERKRSLPWWPRRVAIISSKQAAGYIDFMKIAESRIKGIDFLVCNTQVQGEAAPDLIVQAIEKCNNLLNPPEVITIVRGGGSADDLAAFNDERVVRAIAASQVPVLIGVGHEVDVTLADLAADVRTATPTHAAAVLLPSPDDIKQQVQRNVMRIRPVLYQLVASYRAKVEARREFAYAQILAKIRYQRARVDVLSRLVESLDPRAVLARGYAILRGDPLRIGEQLTIETDEHYITAKVISYEQK